MLTARKPISVSPLGLRLRKRGEVSENLVAPKSAPSRVRQATHGTVTHLCVLLAHPCPFRPGDAFLLLDSEPTDGSTLIGHAIEADEVSSRGDSLENEEGADADAAASTPRLADAGGRGTNHFDELAAIGVALAKSATLLPGFATAHPSAASRS